MPQTVYDVGDLITSRLNLGVDPDGSSVATVTVQRPDGTTIAASPGAWVGREKTAQFYATDDGIAGSATTSAAGDWVAVWRVVGTGASTTPKVYNVAPLPGTSTRPSWSPFLSDVGDHVPFLTIDTTQPADQVYLGTFNGVTSPTDEVAQRHIDRAASIVGAGFTTLSGALVGMARTVTALFAAASLCRAYARDQATRQLADSLSTDARLQLKVLKDAVDNAGTTTMNALPVMYAPAPVPWGDDLLIDGTLPTSSQYFWPQ